MNQAQALLAWRGEQLAAIGPQPRPEMGFKEGNRQISEVKNWRQINEWNDKKKVIDEMYDKMTKRMAAPVPIINTQASAPPPTSLPTPELLIPQYPNFVQQPQYSGSPPVSSQTPTNVPSSASPPTATPANIGFMWPLSEEEVDVSVNEWGTIEDGLHTLNAANPFRTSKPCGHEYDCDCDKQPSGSFTDPTTHRAIDVYPRRGESTSAALQRVKRHHGLNDEGGRSFWDSPNGGKGVIFRSQLLDISYADPGARVHGDVDLSTLPFKVRISPQTSQGRAEIALCHELMHVANQLLKGNLTHEQIQSFAVYLRTEFLPAIESLRSKSNTL